MSSLTKIQYLQIEPNGKGTPTNESMMLKMFICKDSSDQQSAFDGGIKNNYLLAYKLFQFAVE